LLIAGAHRLEVTPRAPRPRAGIERAGGDLLELSANAYVSYVLGTPDEKRDIVTSTSSNFLFAQRRAEFALLPAFREIAQRPRVSCGRPSRNDPRTWSTLVRWLFEWVNDHHDALDDSLLSPTLTLVNDGTETERAA
jgi:hypothetical protein